MEINHDTDTITPDGTDTVLTIGGLGGLVVPSGTTAQRPAATNGLLRFNTDTGALDIVVGTSYQELKGAPQLAATGLTASGSTQGTALAITASVNNVTTVATNTGVVLPIPSPGDRISVVNNGANALNVYPASGGTIGDLATNAPTSLAVGKVLTVVAATTTLWEIQSDTGATGSSLLVADEGITVTTAATSFNFVGAGVTASGGAAVTITIPGGSGALTGTATLDFGSSPGTNIATVTVNTGSVVTGSLINVTMMAASTATHNAYEHMMVPMKLVGGNIVNGVSFDITGVTEWRLTGTFTVRWILL
jgi:hypothetical protein